LSILDRYFTLPAGRKLGYDEHGSSTGQPVFYFHGTPSARVEWEFCGSEEIVNQLGLRLIAVDRPGMGMSDFQADRHIVDWPADVTALADGLGLGRFSVLGFSGGTPYALACALKIPDRLISVGLVSIEAPYSLPGITRDLNPQSLQFLELNRDKPWIARLIQSMMALTARFAPDKLIAQALTALPAPDQAVLSQPKVKKAFLHMVQESMRSGTRGPQVDTALMVSPWGFDPAGIRVNVQMWQGEKDVDAPPVMARYIKSEVPQSKTTFYPEEGHLSVMVNHIKEILTALVS
jgi:pimeloyl-ACP methyl ester carboxylesterase